MDCPTTPVRVNGALSGDAHLASSTYEALDASHSRLEYAQLPLRRVFARLATYFSRLYLWSKVATELKFISSTNGHNGIRRSILYSPLSSLKCLSEFMNLELLEDATVKVNDVGLFNVRAHTDDLYVVLPASERPVLDFIRSYLRPGDVFVDAGANIGFYTILASTIVGRSGKVIAVEMIPETFSRLAAHVELNECDNVVLVNKALADRAGAQIAATLPADGRHGKASIIVGPSPEDMIVHVETDTLENIVRPHARIRLMKLDLEGAESLAIEGAGAGLQRVDAVIFESWDEDHDATSALEEKGFAVTSLDHRNRVAQKLPKSNVFA